MRTWDRFYPDVLPDVLGCPEPTVDRQLLLAAAEFCERGRAWRQILDPITTSAASPFYDISWPDQADGVQLVGAALDNVDIDFEVADGTSLAQKVRGTSGRRRVLCQDLLQVQVLPTPADGQVLLLEAILKPAEGALGVPDFLFNRYGKAIAEGALSKLLLSSKAPWANPALAAVKKEIFDAAIKVASRRAWRANSNARPRNRAQFY